MSSAEPCKFCGCTQTNLVDGFYYCAECGTQDTNIQETLVEYSTMGDGGHGLLGTKRKLNKHLLKTSEIEMTEDWYKWHTMNFLLRGLADEVIACGAQPSFKTKLLWVWTRYMDKYQNKADFGLAANEDSEDDQENKNTFSDIDEDDDDNDEKYDRKGVPAFFLSSKRDIKIIRMPLVISMLYVALNLDKSPIQLAKLLQLMKLGKISIIGWSKLVPQELQPKKLKNCLFFNFKCFIFSYGLVRSLSLTLFRELNLGNPIVPDLRILAEEYLKELCLPNDLKPFVFSLINARSFDFLDINVQYPDFTRMPSYELFVMGHILLALKICFGLDSNYEYELSKTVSTINDEENYAQSYNSNMNPEPTERLFNFQDWCSFITFRKTLLLTHCIHLGSPNYFDVNDYVAMEQLPDKPETKINFKDEIAHDIIMKIPGPEINVIPKSEFVTTLTPFTTYTRVILDHIQDPQVKKLLAEDFTQYSLKYITEDMFLVDPDSTNPKNILQGISKDDKEDTNLKFIIPSNMFHKAHRTRVYVKDCGNHNWLTTQRPNIEHVTNVDTYENDECDEKENDNSFISNLVNNDKDCSNIESINISGSSKIDSHSDLSSCSLQEKDSCVSIHTDTIKLESDIKSDDDDLNDQDQQFPKIQEEDEKINIFDDDFIDLDVKKEEEDDPKPSENENFDVDINFSQNDLIYDTLNNNTDGTESDASSADSLHMNPDTLNRDEAIKELVIHACRKYKVSIPGKFMHRTTKTINKRKPRYMGRKPRHRTKAGEVKDIIDGFLSAYQAHVENDIFHQISSIVQSAVTDFHKTIDDSQTQEHQETPLDEGIEIGNEQIDDNQSLDNTIKKSEDNILKDNGYRLFGDSSDGETHAEELIPKKHPDFDEKTHDIRQLYLKQNKDPGVPEMELNPRLQKIVEQKIRADEKSHTSLEDAQRDKHTSDSEDDLPLSIHLEQIKLRAQLSNQVSLNKSGMLPKLLQNDDIRSYNYWIKTYNLRPGTDNEVFDKILDNDFPKSFAVVLKLCSEVVGYETYFLYRSLQNIEEFLTRNNIHFGNVKKRRVDDLRKSIINNSKRCRDV